jgi:hypothetical protein
MMSRESEKDVQAAGTDIDFYSNPGGTGRTLATLSGLCSNVFVFQ